MPVMIRYSLFFLVCASVHAEEWEETGEARMEVGAAFASQYLAHYRGSDQYRARALPLPFFTYRGKHLQIDRRGVRGELLSERLFEINVSGEASLSGADSDNRLRRGMPELDPSFELGPSLNIALDGNLLDDGWLLRLPLRAVFTASTDGVDYIGYLFNPKITYAREDRRWAWRYSASVGMTWGSEDYHDYYYQVDTPYVLSSRPFYDASSGFSGFYSKLSASRRVGYWRYGASVRYDNLSGTNFADDSPLVATKDYFSFSFLLARYLWSKN